MTHISPTPAPTSQQKKQQRNKKKKRKEKKLDPPKNKRNTTRERNTQKNKNGRNKTNQAKAMIIAGYSEPEPDNISGLIFHILAECIVFFNGGGHQSG